MAHPCRSSSRPSARGACPDEQIEALIHEYFDLRPGAIIRDLDLRRPIYKQTAAFGHFGRDDIDFPWEQTDKADALARRRFAGADGQDVGRWERASPTVRKSADGPRPPRRPRARVPEDARDASR